jgi:NAD(P)-dependent dehydrogenase (short-subunit alcohol dehydrogenase family)
MATFAGKCALVTGGTSGIGRAAALAFGRAGARVVIAGRNLERGSAVVEEIRAGGADAIFVKTDVSRANEVAALFEKAQTAYGRVDCAFNNAAETGELRLTADYTEEEFSRLVAVNLAGVWRCMAHELRVMVAQGGGAIVNTSSVNGLGGAAHSAVYAMTKAGVLALTKSAALEYAARGIRVNALVPGAFRTPMLESVFDRVSDGSAARKAEVESRYTEFIALGRLGTPEEAANAVLWLCSEQASYVTGQSFIVDGGLTAPFR